MKKLIVSFGAFALIVVLSSFSVSKPGMIETKELQGKDISVILSGPGYFTESMTSHYDSKNNVWIDYNSTFLPPIKETEAQIRTLDRMEAVIFPN